MPCSCSNNHDHPIKKEQSFLEIVKDNMVFPLNGTSKVVALARVGDRVYPGSGLLTYTIKGNQSIFNYFFQFIPNDPKAPQIEPAFGIGFKDAYEFKSHDNNHHYEHSLITNRIHLYPATGTAYHITASSSSCTCTPELCVEIDGGQCTSCDGSCIPYA